MKKSRFTDSQILAILKQAENGVPVPELCREHGMNSASFYKWRAKFGGMDASMMTRMKELEKENARLSGCMPMSISATMFCRKPLKKIGEAILQVVLFSRNASGDPKLVLEIFKTCNFMISDDLTAATPRSTIDDYKTFGRIKKDKDTGGLMKQIWIPVMADESR